MLTKGMSIAERRKAAIKVIVAVAVILGGSALVTVLTLLVAVGIPGAAGGTLLYQHFMHGKKLSGSRDQLKRQTQESELLRLAGERDASGDDRRRGCDEPACGNSDPGVR